MEAVLDRGADLPRVGLGKPGHPPSFPQPSAWHEPRIVSLTNPLAFQELGGDLHRHADGVVHSHHHHGPHKHDHRGEGHGHSHGLVDPSIKRSREGLIAVGLSLAVLGGAALLQLAIFVSSGSIALLADLIHNFGDAATAIPLGVAFLLRSERAERIAGLFVVFAIFASACVAGVEAVQRLIHPETPTYLGALGAAGLIGFVGNWIAAIIRTRAGHRLDSAALIADGNHARADAYVSLAVVASAIAVAIGVPIADPLIGLAITTVILRITWASWRTVSAGSHRHA
jgi:Co/Zn/Cd efflux system component